MDDEGPEGIGGWLAFFLVALGLVSPVTALAQLWLLYSDPSIAEPFGRLWTLVQVVEWTLVLLSVAACWYLVWQLVYVRTATTVRMVIAGLWLITVGGTAVEYLVVALASGLPFGALLEASVGDLVRPLIFCAVWTAYFRLSKRVANTYRRDRDGEALADVFS